MLVSEGELEKQRKVQQQKHRASNNNTFSNLQFRQESDRLNCLPKAHLICQNGILPAHKSIQSIYGK